jgi:hypothetical protein
MILESHKKLFDEWAGTALFNMSFHFERKDEDFHMGRLSGGEESIEFMHLKTPPLGLGRILLVGMLLPCGAGSKLGRVPAFAIRQLQSDAAEP